MILTYTDGRTALDTTLFRYKLTTPDGALVKGWTTGVTWTEEPAGTYYLADAAAIPGTRYAVEPTAGEVGGTGQVPWGAADVSALLLSSGGTYLPTGQGATVATALVAALGSASAQQVSAISSAMSSMTLWSNGSGDIPINIITLDPVTKKGEAGVEVWVTKNADGTGGEVHSVTPDSGIIPVRLYAGEHYVWRSKYGVDFDNPQVVQVS